MKRHTFTILAYRQSPYLEECIQTLLAQDQTNSQIIMATSTPSEWLSEVAAKYHIPIHVRNGISSIADDWNFALKVSDTDLVTLIHQDDLYHSAYSEKILQAENQYPDALILFTNFALLIDEKRVEQTVNLTIQRLLLTPFLMKQSIHSRRIRRLTLSLGNPVCCPSVTYNLKNIGDFSFNSLFPNNLDWEAWIRLSRQAGSFVYLREILMTHRFHADSETSASLGDNRRQNDDRRIFDLLWPKPFAAIVAGLYALAYRSKHE